MRNTLLLIFFLSVIVVNAQLIPGTSLFFDGVDDYIDLGDVSGLNFSDSDTFAISLWIKLPPSSSGIDEIITKAGGPGLKGWGLQIRDGRPEFFAVSDFSTQSWYFIQAPKDLRDDQWHFIVFNYNGAANPASNSFFIDGIEINNLTVLANSLNGDFQNTGLAFIGHYDGNNQQAGPEWFIGSMDELKVWDKVLSKIELREQMHLISSDVNNLISYWRFNEGVSDTLIDETGNHNGKLYGGISWQNSAIPSGPSENAQWFERDSVFDLNTIDLSIDYNSQSGAEVFASRINLPPNQIPANVTVLDSQYYVYHLDNAGTYTATFTFRNISNLISQDENRPCDIQIYSRESNSEGNWSRMAEAFEVSLDSGHAKFFVSDFQGQMIIVRDNCTSISYSEIENSIIFPNPTKGVINFEKIPDIKSISIYNSSGTLIKNFKPYNKIDIGGFSQGIYTIRIQAADQLYFRKIIKD